MPDPTGTASSVYEKSMLCDIIDGRCPDPTGPPPKQLLRFDP